MRNIEIKAKVTDVQLLKTNIDKLCQRSPDEICQHDIFYNVPNGRLKLRQFEDQTAELIWYERNDCEGPTLSSYEKSAFTKEQALQMKILLLRAFGIKVEVKKLRLVYLFGQSRIHVDSVKDLGNFMELEVVLNDTQTIEDGEVIANELMEKLGISKENLLATAYADMLLDNVL